MSIVTGPPKTNLAQVSAVKFSEKTILSPQPFKWQIFATLMWERVKKERLAVIWWWWRRWCWWF